MWYRQINDDISKEIEILERRMSANSHEDYASTNDCETFTHLSAFQFLETSIPQYYFNNQNPGVAVGIVLFDDAERMVYWRNSSRTEVSDSVFKEKYQTKQEFESLLKDLGFVHVSEAEAAKMFSERYKKEFAEHENFLTKYKTLNNDPYVMAWTEGLFRYNVEDVKYVVCDGKNREKAEEFYQFLIDNRGHPQGIKSGNELNITTPEK